MNTEEQINLVDEVSKILEEAGHPRPQDWKRYLDQNALISDTMYQRFLINRCFRQILGEVTTEVTMDVRYCLVDNGKIKDWLRLFKQGVVPCIVRLNLPPSMN